MTLILAALATVCGLARLVLFLALHLVRSEYSITSHAVSDYAVGSTRRLSSAMTWVTVPFWGLLAAAVAIGIPEWPDSTLVSIALAVLALIFAFLPFVPTDLEGEKLSTTGRLHYLMAIAWFAISYACMGNLVRLFTAEGPAPLAQTLHAVSWIALVSLVISVVALIIRPLRAKAFGIAERVFILSVSLFYIGTALGIIVIAA